MPAPSYVNINVSLPHSKVVLSNGDVLEYTVTRKIRARDTVELVGQPNFALTVLCIHAQDTNPDRQWAVVAYKSDIPRVVKLSEVVRLDAA